MNLTQQFFQNILRIPLIVGITGHTDIQTPENKIAAQLSVFWKKIQELAGSETPVILLTSIATGADHLAVKYLPPNVKYCAVLPFDEAEYRKDFSEQSLIDFEEDIRSAYKVINCQASKGDYTLAADYVRKHSDVLLTMWDGYGNLDRQSGKAEAGGTYYQIRAALKMDDLLLQRQEKKQLVVNIPVDRRLKNAEYHSRNGEKITAGYSNEKICVIMQSDVKGGILSTPFVDYKLLDEEAFSQLDSEDNTDFSAVIQFLRKYNENFPATPYEDNYLRPEMEKYTKAMDIVQEDFIRYEHFNKLAMMHQTPHNKQFFWIGLFSVIIGILGQAWGDLTFSSNDSIHECVLHGIIFVYLLGCIGIFLFGKKIAREDHYSHYLKPRVIAEHLRLKIFWKLTGIQDSFTEYLLGESSGYLFSLPFCNWMIAAAPLSAENQRWLVDGEGLAAVQKCWLEDQQKYYNSYLLPDPNHFFLSQEGEKCKALPFLSIKWLKQYFKKYERLEGYSAFCKAFFTWSGFILSGVLILVFISAQIFDFDHTEILALSWYREFLVGICPFMVAMLGWLLEKKKWDSLGHHYRNTAMLFDKTISFVSNADHTTEDKQKIIKELMLFTHQENAGWNDIKKNAKPEPMT